MSVVVTEIVVVVVVKKITPVWIVRVRAARVTVTVETALPERMVVVGVGLAAV